MNIFLTFKIALSALNRTKTRSLLTVLGVIIGVAAVIAMVSIGESAKAKVAKSFESMGTNTLIIRSGSSAQGGVRGGAGSQDTITWDDMKALRTEIDSLIHVAPELSTNSQVLSDSTNWSTRITGTESEWFTIRNLAAEKGELFSEIDVAAANKVAVVGKTVSEALFGVGVDPVGMQIRIGHVPFTIVALAEAKGASAFGSDNDDQVIIPVSTYEQKIAGGSRQFIRGSILAQARDAGSSAEAKLAIEELLGKRHRIGDGDADFQVRDPSEIAAAQTDSADTITSLLAGVALVSLLVGGIGIMNIMLVSVTERTREIGLRMAVGAKEAHVLAQFLVEAVVLSLLGGILGIAAGVAAAKYMAASFGFPLVLDGQIMVVAVAVSGLVGIVFGLYPARKASQLDPIAALRFE